MSILNRKLVVLGTWLPEKHVDKIRQLAKKKGFISAFYRDEEEAREQGFIDEAEVIFGHARETAALSDKLRWLCLPSAGVDIFLRPGGLRSDEIILTNSSGAYGATLSEHMVMQTLMLLRRMPEFQEGMSRREWLPPRWQGSVKYSRVTVMGAGDIGKCYARRIRAFEPETIIAVNRSGKCDEPAFDRVIPWTQLDQVLPETDILAMCMPATARTIGILDEKRIALLKDHAYIINVGRGNAIDEKALIRALNEGHLAGAALDVMQHEPLPADDPLWDAKNVILTPHVAGNMTTKFTVDRAASMFMEDFLNYTENRPMRYLVNKELGY